MDGICGPCCLAENAATTPAPRIKQANEAAQQMKIHATVFRVQFFMPFIVTLKTLQVNTPHYNVIDH